MEETVVLQGLSIGYRSGKSLRVVAQGIFASLFGGELTCLIGSNGVGKSTLLRTLSAFQPPLSGGIFLRDSAEKTMQPIASLSSRWLAQHVGVVLTDKLNVGNLTVRELVGFGRSPYTGFFGTLSPSDETVVDEAIRQIGIADLSDRLIHTLSDGERQKVMIAKALAQQTPIIFLDEPTAFLDFPSKVEVLQMLRRLAHDLHKTIFLSTHDVELALQLSDKLWLMEKSTEGDSLQFPQAHLLVGTPRELADDGSLARFIERKGIVFDEVSLTIRVE